MFGPYHIDNLTRLTELHRMELMREAETHRFARQAAPPRRSLAVQTVWKAGEMLIASGCWLQSLSRLTTCAESGQAEPA